MQGGKKKYWHPCSFTFKLAPQHQEALLRLSYGRTNTEEHKELECGPGRSNTAAHALWRGSGVLLIQNKATQGTEQARNYLHVWKKVVCNTFSFRHFRASQKKKKKTWQSWQGGEIASMLQGGEEEKKRILLQSIYRLWCILIIFWKRLKGVQHFHCSHETHKYLDLSLSCKVDLCFGVEIHVWSHKHVADVEKTDMLCAQKWFWSPQHAAKSQKGRWQSSLVYNVSKKTDNPQVIIFICLYIAFQ